mmetsp:Transcript_51009/g.87769  ORF Transcript_51009/g.87769 Transcript_51009/m.87769 type:complete len:110 (-) Transcript_51009:22-351(-)
MRGTERSLPSVLTARRRKAVSVSITTSCKARWMMVIDGCAQNQIKISGSSCHSCTVYEFWFIVFHLIMLKHGKKEKTIMIHLMMSRLSFKSVAFQKSASCTNTQHSQNP